jgi:uncharacterized membrane protein YjfL (UPF0719 family)
LLLSLAIIIALFASLRLFAGLVSHVDSSFELTQKDNAAFGISLGGVVFGVTIVLVGIIPSSWTQSLATSLITVTVYGIVGILLMFLTRVIFDRWVLPRFSIRDQIIKGNIAVAIVDAGNVIAAALVIAAVISWITTDTLKGLLTLFAVYIMSQAVLTFAGVAHVRLFAKCHPGRSLQKEFYDGNAAVALHFAGRRIGMAFAITAASHIMVYELYPVSELLVQWTVLSFALLLGMTFLSHIASKIILFGLKVSDELINQRNIAIGAVQGVIYISLGLIVASLMN